MSVVVDQFEVIPADRPEPGGIRPATAPADQQAMQDNVAEALRQQAERALRLRAY